MLLSLGRVQGVTSALQLIADHLAGIPGRKSLIWLAGQFPDPFPSTNKTLLEAYRPKSVRELNSLLAAGVAIYPVDASELKPDRAFDVDNEDIGIHPLMPGEAPHLPMFSGAALSAIELANRSGEEACLIRMDWRRS